MMFIALKVGMLDDFRKLGDAPACLVLGFLCLLFFLLFFKFFIYCTLPDSNTICIKYQ